jgi:tRNA (cmo5U34)-methyltransferase
VLRLQIVSTCRFWQIAVTPVVADGYRADTWSRSIHECPYSSVRRGSHAVRRRFDGEAAKMVDLHTVQEWRHAPRLTSFFDFFEQTARGSANQPDLDIPLANVELLGFDVGCLTFWDTHRRLWGNFDSHYFASIPYRLEEECRLGSTIFDFGLRTWARAGRSTTVYTLGAGAGTLSRTLAKLGDGRFKTLTCSPTPANRISFLSHRPGPDAHFYLGAFFELDDERYATDENLAPFRDGFDVLLEDTTFQMYGPNRVEQLAVIAPRIRPDGLLIQVQKVNQQDSEEYARRERQKDDVFKARFFSAAQIAGKRRDVLDTMDDQQVDLEASIAALAEYFAYTVVTWNSGNFYTIVSSGSLSVLRSFVMSMISPAIPEEYCCEHLPLWFERGIASAEPQNSRWRQPQTGFVQD